MLPSRSGRCLTLFAVSSGYLARLVLIAAVIGQGGCDAWSQYRRFPAGADDTIWRPTGVAEANLDAMVAHPGDLVTGHGLTTSDGQRGASAVDKMRRDHVIPLPQSDISTVGAGGGGGPAPAGAGGT
jgi:type IV pilus biogenesis protein CpaD/CtpE